MKNTNWSVLKKSICGASAAIVIIVTLLGFTWGMDQHWTPREIHTMFVQATYDQFKKMDKRNLIRDAQRDVQYWLKIEMFWRVERQRNPCQGNQQQLQNAIMQRVAAEKRQTDLQGD